jgi:hypothetical protein
MARWVSVAATTTHQSTRVGGPATSGGGAFDVRELGDLTDLHLDLVEQRGEARSPLDRFLLGPHLDQRETGDDLFRLGEGPVGDRLLATGRAPFALGRTPSPASSTPALVTSSMKPPIRSRNSGLGEKDSGLRSSTLCINRNRIVLSSLGWGRN